VDSVFLGTWATIPRPFLSLSHCIHSISLALTPCSYANWRKDFGGYVQRRKATRVWASLRFVSSSPLSSSAAWPFKPRLIRSSRGLTYDERNNPLERWNLDHSPSYPPACILYLIPLYNRTCFATLNANAVEVKKIWLAFIALVSHLDAEQIL